MISVEFSASQNCFHIDELKYVLTMNQQNAMRRNSNDYQIIALVETDEEADEFVEEFRKRQRTQACVMPL
jgi:hypothetical protein